MNIRFRICLWLVHYYLDFKNGKLDKNSSGLRYPSPIMIDPVYVFLIGYFVYSLWL